MFPEPNHINAKKFLDYFIENGLSQYSKSRNFDFGPKNRNNVSRLSPFIKKRIIHEKEIILSCLKKFTKSQIEKFIQEIFWRVYWKGWLEGRPKVWKNYLKQLNEYHINSSRKNFHKTYVKAINGQTDIQCFDSWVLELKEFGYLHNHARMWFASIWIFTLNLPWQLGADFFYRNLLDADAASNTLSWRWVAGLHTPGKFYLAKQGNIEKFSNFSFKSGPQLKEKVMTPVCELYEYQKPKFSNTIDNQIDFFLINPNNLIYKKELIDRLNNSQVIYLESFEDKLDSITKISFEKNALNHYFKWLKNNGINLIKISDEDKLKKFTGNKPKDIFTFYPCVGYEKDRINKISLEFNLNIKYIYDSFDLKCWPYAKSGFFKFKNNINSILNNIS